MMQVIPAAGRGVPRAGGRPPAEAGPAGWRGSRPGPTDGYARIPASGARAGMWGVSPPETAADSATAARAGAYGGGGGGGG